MSEHPEVPAGDQVMIVGPDGTPVGTVRVPGGEPSPREADEPDEAEADNPSAAVEEPAKVMRIGTMIKQLLEEVRATELDDASRRRLKEIHAASLRELEAALSPELREELARIIAPFDEDATPSDGELRIAQAQLVGWLEGLFHGIQTAIYAQQMAARAQLEQMRRSLPAGPSPDSRLGVPGAQGETNSSTNGMYL
jgi:hypothetical protein